MLPVNLNQGDLLGFHQKNNSVYQIGGQGYAGGQRKVSLSISNDLR